jgi:hypothetical protein
MVGESALRHPLFRADQKHHEGREIYEGRHEPHRSSAPVRLQIATGEAARLHVAMGEAAGGDVAGI